MAISITWGTKVINIPQADLTYISGNTYELDVDVFRMALKGLEDSEDGMCHPDTHIHNTEVVLGGITYARFIEITNGYTITFEDGQYIVNLTGANNNILDVTNLNQVSIRSSNSAGLVAPDSEWTNEEKINLSDNITSIKGAGFNEDTDSLENITDSIFSKTGLTASGTKSFNDIIKVLFSMACGKIVNSGSTYSFYDDDNTTLLFTITMSETSRMVS